MNQPLRSTFADCRPAGPRRCTPEALPDAMPDAAPDPADLRRTLACFATGVAVITTADADGRPWGVTVNSFNSVSLDPPLVLWSLARRAWSLAVWQRAEGFAVNILAADQAGVARLFASRTEERFADVEWRADDAGLPLLAGTVASLSCRAWARHDGGDHEIFLGRVIAARRSERRPLAVCQGAMGPLAIG